MEISEKMEDLVRASSVLGVSFPSIKATVSSELKGIDLIAEYEKIKAKKAGLSARLRAEVVYLVEKIRAQEGDVSQAKVL